MLVSSQFIGDDVVLRPSLYRKGKNHSLHSMFNYLMHGYSLQRMREVEKDILPEMIDETRAILLNRNAQFFPDTQGEKTLHDYRVLIDENIPPCVADSLKMHFRRVAHVQDVGLVGKKDDAVWNWAVNNEYNIIFTKDRANRTDQDLTFLAVQDARSILTAMNEWGGDDSGKSNNFRLSDLPLVVHLPGGSDPDVELKRLLRSKKDNLFNFVSNRATPYIDILNGRIICGPTYFELRGENYVADNNISESATFARKVQTPELFKALWLGKLSSQEIRYMDPDREKKVDAQIENYMQGLAMRKPNVFRERRLALQAERLSHLPQPHHVLLEQSLPCYKHSTIQGGGPSFLP